MSLPECSVTQSLAVCPHRSTLDSKENSLQAALQELEGGRGKERALQSRLEEEQLQRLQSEAQSTKALEVRAGGPCVPVLLGSCVRRHTREEAVLHDAGSERQHGARAPMLCYLGVSFSARRLQA